MSHIKIIGIGDNGKESLLPTYKKWIYESELLVGGERQLSFFEDYKGETIVIKSGLSKLVELLKSSNKEVVVLASGDPLFYGIGGYLSKKMEVEIYPNLSSIQLAYAKAGESWQNAYCASIHGRSMKGLAQRIDGKDNVILLTDDINSPQTIAKYLLHYDMTEYKAFVGENLGSDDEKTGWYTLKEMQDSSFSSLNVVILSKKTNSPMWTMGIPDAEFSQRKPDKGLITKKEVRVLSLMNMALTPTSIVWDIGTCTGSVGIEAARMARDGEVYAIEKNEKDLENCLENMKKFRVDMTVQHNKAPEGLEGFPDPDAIFIGGTGGEMKTLLNICCARLKQNGRIVLNAATVETLYEASQAFKEEGYKVEITLAQISRSKPILHMNRFDALNPIYIITASREEEELEVE
ncbi:precorrin-6y C5,15-methyltransferase (decarboxylating) subunit CbiE [Chengkuizengella axinellae]|uniref:Precorrin-6y C5,15-methyltransferase (Decarboxylating) subunit CbiE n=1 Tax=Chengkuizengella axinellae TaxID=3064388 RepID=A0ABT9IXT4_9BACL|nr:precorrin-6y C5,15-methyltransferase (decarboxylating) subunit CbiE [Chengkuizengella sp. 2205SS18-9]MDP5274176.1 precorrin-6y C5,15-methyltransferase (decarboxylating) subunit CbiE [Chengkuizengella sp. 2205SS18-9]